MFGMGAGELIVLVIVALLFLGPDKLPDAAKTLSKGIRDFRKQTRELQKSIEDDEDIGGAIRDLKSALRGDELASRQSHGKTTVAAARNAGAITAGTPAAEAAGLAEETSPATEAASTVTEPTGETAEAQAPAAEAEQTEAADSDLPQIRPAAGTVASSALGRGPAAATRADESDPDNAHG